MTLGEMIERLRKEDPNRVIEFGFGEPHSYRGYYDQLAFEPKANVSIKEMLADAEGCVGKEFTGYKGGEFVMGDHTDVWLSEYGRTGETIGPHFLELMLN